MIRSQSQNRVEHPPDESAVRIESLTKQFGAFTAVDNISLLVKRGEIFGFLGANGAGKTTAIRMLCGLLTPTSGEAWVVGLSIKTHSAHIKSRIGYMSQKFSLYLDLTVDENFSLYGGVYGLSARETRERGGELLDRLGLHSYRRELTAKVPLGFKQRLALGCAVLHRPPVIFLDEPTGGVDPVARREFWDLIYELADGGSTIFVTTHYMDEAEYCSRVSIMERGRIIALGSPRELKDSAGEQSMQDVFIRLLANTENPRA
jgi:ABC-2 type transport system ATP-binding protein